MTDRRQGIHALDVCGTPLSVVDVETTGLSPGGDRVIEVSVVRIDPNDSPRIVLNTLVNPERPVAATEIHGITDADVADAPVFAEIVPALTEVLAGSVVAGYNVYFDMRFLEYELARTGIDELVPYLCLMYMRPLLGLGKRCSLDDACRLHGVNHGNEHHAAGDALAAAGLWQAYQSALVEYDIRTWGDLTTLKNYKFLRSFDRDPIAPPRKPEQVVRMKSRSLRTTTTPVNQHVQTGYELSVAEARRRYWEALKVVLADLEITDDELVFLEEEKEQIKLEPQQIRSLHARAFAQAIAQFIDDKWLDDNEAQMLHKLHGCLSKLGWAPGE